MKEIDSALNLFWFSNLQPSKINLGIANYGRGYTIADKDCPKYDCTWSDPSKAGECTQLEGILSQCEIQRIIRAKNLSPTIIAGGAGVKQIAFDDQWVGYDDDETIELKTRLANYRCLGGTVLWAIDYASCGNSSVETPSTLHSRSMAPAVSAPIVSIASSSVAPSPLPGLSGNPTPSASELFSFIASSAHLPSQLTKGVSSTSPPIFATRTEAESFTPPPNVAPANSSVGSSAPSVPSFRSSPMPLTSAISTQKLSAAWSTTILFVSLPAPDSTYSSQKPQSKALLPSLFSRATRTSSELFSSVLPQTVSRITSPFMTVPSIGSSHRQQSSGLSQYSIMRDKTTAEVSSGVPPSKAATSTSTSVVSLLLYSSSFAWKHSAASSSVLGKSSSSLMTLEATLNLETTTKIWSMSTKETTSTVPSNILDGSLRSSKGSAGSANVSSSFGASVEHSATVTPSKTQLSPTWRVLLSQATSSTISFAELWSSSLSQITTANTNLSQSTGHSTITNFESISSFGTSSNVVASDASSASHWSNSLNTEGHLNASSSSGQILNGVMTSSTAVVSSPYWSDKLLLSVSMTSGIYTSSPLATSEPKTPKLNSSRIQTENHITGNKEGTTSDLVTTVYLSHAANTSSALSDFPPGFPSSTSNVFAIPTPTGTLSSICPRCSEFNWCRPLASMRIYELSSFPPTECLGAPWCTKCWPKPFGFNIAICPLQCWLLEWCKPLCGSIENLPTELQKPGADLEWFTDWWWKLPVKGCVPNDCEKECVSWYGLTLAIFKRPVCPCVPRTCTKLEDKENKEKKRCKLFGCGELRILFCS